MALVTVLGPGGFSRPPYASFSGKPPFTPSRSYTQTFTVLSALGVSHPPETFTAKPPFVPPAKTGGAGWFPEWDGRKRKRWFEELQEEYSARWLRENPAPPSPAKGAVKARKLAKKLVEEAKEGYLEEENAKRVIELSVAVERSSKLVDTLKYAEQLQTHIKRMLDEEEEELMMVLSLL